MASRGSATKVDFTNQTVQQEHLRGCSTDQDRVDLYVAIRKQGVRPSNIIRSLKQSRAVRTAINTRTIKA